MKDIDNYDYLRGWIDGQKGWGSKEIRMIFELIPLTLKEIRAEAIKLSLTTLIK